MGDLQSLAGQASVLTLVCAVVSNWRHRPIAATLALRWTSLARFGIARCGREGDRWRTSDVTKTLARSRRGATKATPTSIRLYRNRPERRRLSPPVGGGLSRPCGRLRCLSCCSWSLLDRL